MGEKKKKPPNTTMILSIPKRAKSCSTFAVGIIQHAEEVNFNDKYSFCLFYACKLFHTAVSEVRFGKEFWHIFELH